MHINLLNTLISAPQFNILIIYEIQFSSFLKIHQCLLAKWDIMPLINLLHMAKSIVFSLKCLCCLCSCCQSREIILSWSIITTYIHWKLTGNTGRWSLDLGGFGGVTCPLGLSCISVSCGENHLHLPAACSLRWDDLYGHRSSETIITTLRIMHCDVIKVTESHGNKLKSSVVCFFSAFSNN